MTSFNDIIHQPMRLRIMAALRARPLEEALDFRELKSICSATDGNLGAHLNTLEQAGYITVHKSFIGKRPNTKVLITPSGRRAFDQHIQQLRALIDPTP